VYGSSHLGGLGLQSLWVAQGIDQICLFVKSWRANNIAGQFSRVALAWAQHNSGVGTHSFFGGADRSRAKKLTVSVPGRSTEPTGFPTLSFDGNAKTNNNTVNFVVL
jgi:hypothetical protein